KFILFRQPQQDVSMPMRDRMSQKASAHLEKAIESAIKYCIDNNILKEYLEQNSSEVNSMLTTEFDLDEYTEVIRMETRERALAEGKKEVQSYVLELMAQGLSYEEIKKKIEEVS
ncbi:MAG: hypothetical protein FWG13_03240, partial [Leptospirales bacterium]|nr:hypothetical protein [Leptospirales bacterium]